MFLEFVRDKILQSIYIYLAETCIEGEKKAVCLPVRVWIPSLSFRRKMWELLMSRINIFSWVHTLVMHFWSLHGHYLPRHQLVDHCSVSGVARRDERGNHCGEQRAATCLQCVVIFFRLTENTSAPHASPRHQLFFFLSFFFTWYGW